MTRLNVLATSSDEATRERCTMRERRRLLQQPPRVVRRFVQFRMSLVAKATARAVARRRLPGMERERRQAIDQAFETVKHYALKAERWEFPAVKLLFNIGLYLMIAERDIQCLKIDALTHPDEWTRKLNARAVQDKIRKKFSFVRNAVIAHRDPDGLAQYRAIRDLRTEEVFEVGMEFYTGVSRYLSVLTQMMRQNSSFEALLRQWAPQPKAAP
jgi:hypothetical protein